MKEPPNFFMSAAGEMRGDLAAVRACWVKGRLRDNVRDDYMLIRIEPALLNQDYDLPLCKADMLIIATRYRGFTLFPVTEWPSHVYIVRMLDDAILEKMTFVADQVEIIGWGMIFRTAEEAERQIEKFAS